MQHEIAGLTPGGARTTLIGQPVLIGGMTAGAIAWEVVAGDGAAVGHGVDTLSRASARLAAWLQPASETTPTAATQSSADTASLVLALTGEVVKAADLEEAARVSPRCWSPKASLKASASVCAKADGGGASSWWRCPTRHGSTASGSSLAHSLRAAMDECAHQQRSIIYPRSRVAQPVVDLAHSQLARHPGASNVCSVPMASNGSVVGVLTLQRASADISIDVELAMLEHVAAFVGPALALQRRAEAGFAAKLKSSVVRGANGRTDRALRRVVARYRRVRAVFGSVSAACSAPDRGAGTAAGKSGALIGRTARRLHRQGTREAGRSRGRGSSARGIRTRGCATRTATPRSRTLASRERIWRSARQARSSPTRDPASAHRTGAVALGGLVLRDIDKARVTAPFAGVVLNGDLSRVRSAARSGAESR